MHLDAVCVIAGCVNNYAPNGDKTTFAVMSCFLSSVNDINTIVRLEVNLYNSRLHATTASPRAPKQISLEDCSYKGSSNRNTSTMSNKLWHELLHSVVMTWLGENTFAFLCLTKSGTWSHDFGYNRGWNGAFWELRQLI